MIGTKICSRCKDRKVLDEFPVNSRFPDGRNSKCKLCTNALNKAYRDSNKEAFCASRRRHYIANLEKMRSGRRKYAASNKDKKSQYDVSYRAQNKSKIAAYKKQWERNLMSDPVFRIKRNLRRRISHVLNGRLKTADTFSLVGCTPSEFRDHIQSQWTEGMSWDNYGYRGWHVDHVIPCCSFDLSTEDGQRRCFHFSNQRPLWALDNLRKGRKIPDPLPLS